MNTKSITLIITFAAVAIALNAVRIPTFYWPGMFYTLCDIPIVVAFLIFGFKIGLLVEGIHVLGQEIFFPVGPGAVVAYPMGFVTNLLMVFGIIVGRFIAHKAASENQIGEKRKIAYLTGFAAAFRGGIMPIVDYFLLYHILLPLVLGRVIPKEYIAALVPAFFAYNVTSALYVVPIAILVAWRVSKYLRIEPSLPI
jgi:riboflavin transporter FmnP